MSSCKAHTISSLKDDRRWRELFNGRWMQSWLKYYVVSGFSSVELESVWSEIAILASEVTDET